MRNRLDDVPVDVGAWRLKHGLTIVGAAELLGVSRTTIAKYENGAPVPRVVRLAMIGAEQEMSVLVLSGNVSVRFDTPGQPPSLGTKK